MHSSWLSELFAQAGPAVGTLAGLAGSTMIRGGPGDTAGQGRAAPLDWSDPYDNLYAFGKIWAGYDAPQVGAFHGLMYARIGSRRLLPLFGYTGTGVMQARIDADGNLWIRGKETGYFTDLASGDILDVWDNPFTGERVEVFDFYNPAMGGRLTAQMPRFAMGTTSDEATLMNEGTHRDAGGMVPFLLPFERYGDDLMLAWDYAHEYTNPVTPARWPKASTGARISPSEHFTFTVSNAEMQDRSAPSCRYTAGFARLSQWWPWMRMGGHELAETGLVFGRMFSHKGLPDHGDVPRKVLERIEQRAPEFLEPPRDWPQVMPHGTWEAYAAAVPPEVPAA